MYADKTYYIPFKMPVVPDNNDKRNTLHGAVVVAANGNYARNFLGAHLKQI